MCFNKATSLFTCSVLFSHSACSPLTQVGGAVIFKQDVFSFLTSSLKMGLTLIIVGLAKLCSYAKSSEVMARGSWFCSAFLFFS